jgi:hypothetical protein
MKKWQLAFRHAAKSLSLDGLQALLKALRDDDDALEQGTTTVPTWFYGCREVACEGGCAIGFAAWKSGAVWARDVQAAFLRVCDSFDGMDGLTLGDFTGWFDHTPRDQMRAELIQVVEAVITERVTLGARSPEPQGTLPGHEHQQRSYLEGHPETRCTAQER